MNILKKNKTKKIRHIAAGILVFVIAACAAMAYGIPKLYASPQEKVLKTIQQSGITLEEIMQNYIDKIVALNPMGNSSYTGNIRVSELMYDGVDYRPDTTGNVHSYNIKTDNNNIVLTMPQIEDGTLIVDKNDILSYGIGKIDQSHTEPVLRAVLSHLVSGYKTAVKDSIQTAAKTDDNVYMMVISDESLIAGFDTFVEGLYKDPVILPYISLLNVHKITKDSIKAQFNAYARNVYTTVNMSVDSQGKMTGIELVFNQNVTDDAGDVTVGEQIGYILAEFVGEESLYDSVALTVKTTVQNDIYVDADMKLDMQDMENIQYSIDAYAGYKKHSLRVKADGDIR